MRSGIYDSLGGGHQCLSHLQVILTPYVFPSHIINRAPICKLKTHSVTQVRKHKHMPNIYLLNSLLLCLFDTVLTMIDFNMLFSVSSLFTSWGPQIGGSHNQICMWIWVYTLIGPLLWIFAHSIGVLFLQKNEFSISYLVPKIIGPKLA